ncbi:NADP-dependent 3-hydroxy acid dehydrogenase YdfG [Pseudoxanthobacter soli DSM 19599]|uniref:NADP-dependent 3-hydroxy acid dehydrogenase YdfG n=1 Tax=Pseudoxanthobacter soli DSM 19599 TaxID=1123029 RepID=A0A1M7ZNM3_9HYPH|nr:SDR family oxidoreductase [Pseudoxanthobacter soli]SHO66471.1 NADP-dependent 3-hydroxy acid dehydrogenase YdfG [Pseudoxanthobacter soli DSM 19599]
MTDSGKVALVTGAGTGIGKAVALALAAAGYRLVVTGRRREPLEAVVAEAGGEAVAIPADITDPASVAALFEAIRQRFGRLDVLFNNAGAIAPPVNIEDLPVEQWKTVIDTNVTGVFLCTQAAFRLMKDQNPRGGRIINNGSVSSERPRPNSAPYAASKHAVLGLTRSTAIDGRKYDIACGQIDIGNTETPMASQMKKGVLQPDLSIKVEPTFDVSHVADAVLYMAGLPLDANVLQMTVMATKMPLVGRG